RGMAGKHESEKDYGFYPLPVYSELALIKNR
ncbi:hypothetical protein AVEN_207213-1, partial [Araneus ventricosus]